MNRHARRAAEARNRKTTIMPREIDGTCDIQVDGKGDRLVMVFANAKGRTIVEDIWPDVEWTTDEFFASVHASDWLFTHIRVTKLQPCFEAKTPLAFASPDALGFAVACELQRKADPQRVVFYSGGGRELAANKVDGAALKELDEPLFAEHVPAGWHARSSDKVARMQ